MYKKTPTPFSFCFHPQMCWDTQSTALLVGWVHDRESMKPTRQRGPWHQRSSTQHLFRRRRLALEGWPFTRTSVHPDTQTSPRSTFQHLQPPEAKEARFWGSPRPRKGWAGLEENCGLCQMMSSGPAALTHVTNILRLILVCLISFWQRSPFLFIDLIFILSRGKESGFSEQFGLKASSCCLGFPGGWWAACGRGTSLEAGGSLCLRQKPFSQRRFYCMTMKPQGISLSVFISFISAVTPLSHFVCVLSSFD